MKLLYVINDFAFLLSHRRYLVEQAIAAGHDVTVVVPEVNTLPGAADLAVRRIHWPLARKSRNPGTELQSFLSLWSTLRREKPDVVHAITIKPVIYAGILSRLLGYRLIASISGMGFTYISQRWRDRLFRRFVDLLYRFALSSPTVTVIFQNSSDREAFLDRKIVRPEQTRLIAGVGVAIDEFLPSTPLTTPVSFVLPARMLSAKGVREFAESARLLREKYPAAKFVLVGSLDPDNPHGIERSEIEGWIRDGFIEWQGFRSDMPGVYEEASVVVLPSYREGFSKVLMEAAAAGRAIVTTDVPGCREAVEEGRNGFLVAPRNSASLMAAMQRFLIDPALAIRLGKESRLIAENRFSRDVLTRPVLELYRAPSQH